MVLPNIGGGQGIGSAGGAVGGQGIPNPTGQLYNLPIVGSLFPNPNEERLQRQMALAARNYAAYRPEAMQARQGALNTRLMPYQGPANLLTAMSGGTQPFDASGFSRPPFGPGAMTTGRVQQNPTNEALRALETSLETAPGSPEELRAREAIAASQHPRPASWPDEWLWDTPKTHLSEISPGAKEHIATSPGSAFASGYNPFMRGETVQFGQPNIPGTLSPSVYADYVREFGGPAQTGPVLSPEAFGAAMAQPPVRLPQNAPVAPSGAGARAAGRAGTRASRASGGYYR